MIYENELHVNTFESIAEDENHYGVLTATLLCIFQRVSIVTIRLCETYKDLIYVKLLASFVTATKQSVYS